MHRPLRALALGALLVAAPLTLAACANFGQTAAQAHLTTSRGLYVAEQAFRGLSDTLEAAVDRGALTGARAAQARTILAQAHDTLLLARQGKASSDAVLDAVANAEALVPAAPN